jgi:mono/diheme cytochrome c family protein
VIRKILGVGAAIYFAALAIVGAQMAPTPANSPQQEAKADPALIDQGKKTYAEKCSHCHGFGMVSAGTVAPDLRKFPDDKSRFVTTVKLGKNNRMPPWGDILNDEQIDEIWFYASSRRTP